MYEFFTYIYLLFSDVWDVLSSSGLIKAAIGSAFGAFGGAYCLWAINRKKDYEIILSDINYVLAILIAHMNSLLNFKRQHALPFCKEMDNIINILDNPQEHAKGNIVNIEAHKIFMSVVEIDYNTEGLLEKLAPYAGTDTKSVLLAIKIMESLMCVRDITLMRN